MPAPPPALPAPIPGSPGIASLVPFGLGKDKPHHYLEMLEVLWDNRDALPYAWRILNEGVCDGCSLGPRGLKDDVIEGTHVCLTRLRLLRLNTMPAFKPEAVADIGRLRAMSNRDLHALGRVPYPLLYRPGDPGFRRVGWAEALALAGEAIRAAPGPRQAWFATSRGTTNETYYAFTKAARLCGTNNVDVCARLCHQASVAGLKRTIGVGAPTISLKDLIGTDLLVLWGADIANNQPVTMKYLAHAKDQGTRVVVINPVREKGLEAYWVPSMPVSALFGTKLCDDFLQIRIGGDLALICGVLKCLIDGGRVDRAFVAAHTEGWEELEAGLAGVGWEEITELSGLAREQIAWLAELYGRARTAVTLWSMGITQHTFGTESVQGIAAIHLARGLIGKPLSGLMPIRGHSGVQGASECGVGPGILPGGVPNDAAGRARFGALWGQPLPDHPGMTTVPMVQAMLRGEIDVLYNLGGNLHAVLPDPEGLRQAFAKVGLRIHQDIVFNTSTVLEGAGPILVLPAQTRYEQRGGGTSTSTERRVRFSPEVTGHPQVGECRPEYEIPAQIAAAAHPHLAAAFAWPDSRAIREEMEQAVPMYAGISGLKKAGDWVQWGGELLCRDGQFPTPDGRARFQPVRPRRLEVPPGHLYLTTRRGKQFNSIVLKDHDSIHGGRARDDIYLSAEDIAAFGLKDGGRVRLWNDLGEMTGTARLADIRPGAVQAYWPECNGLIATRCDPLSEEPDYNAPVRVAPG